MGRSDDGKSSDAADWSRLLEVGTLAEHRHPRIQTLSFTVFFLAQHGRCIHTKIYPLAPRRRVRANNYSRSFLLLAQIRRHPDPSAFVLNTLQSQW